MQLSTALIVLPIKFFLMVIDPYIKAQVKNVSGYNVKWIQRMSIICFFVLISGKVGIGDQGFIDSPLIS